MRTVSARSRAAAAAREMGAAGRAHARHVAYLGPPDGEEYLQERRHDRPHAPPLHDRAASPPRPRATTNGKSTSSSSLSRRPVRARRRCVRHHRDPGRDPRAPDVAPRAPAALPPACLVLVQRRTGWQRDDGPPERAVVAACADCVLRPWDADRACSMRVGAVLASDVVSICHPRGASVRHEKDWTGAHPVTGGSDYLCCGSALTDPRAVLSSLRRRPTQRQRDRVLHFTRRGPAALHPGRVKCRGTARQTMVG